MRIIWFTQRRALGHHPQTGWQFLVHRILGESHRADYPQRPDHRVSALLGAHQSGDKLCLGDYCRVGWQPLVYQVPRIHRTHDPYRDTFRFSDEIRIHDDSHHRWTRWEPLGGRVAQWKCHRAHHPVMGLDPRRKRLAH